VAAHTRALGLPTAILRPMAFTELMTERKFFPPASVWHLMPRLMGPDRPVEWLTVEDLAAIAAKAFGDPERFIGRDLSLASDVQSIEACRAIWRDIGRKIGCRAVGFAPSPDREGAAICPPPGNPFGLKEVRSFQ
jgi:hypothetical protein